jgi:hypothetical protein
MILLGSMLSKTDHHEIDTDSPSFGDLAMALD